MNYKRLFLLVEGDDDERFFQRIVKPRLEKKYYTKRFGSKIDFVLEILKHFSIEIANQKNRSFRYFLEKYNCED